jgi:hypothetical protein
MEQNPLGPMKDFWGKKEGITGMVIPAVLIVLVVYFWGKIVPFLVNIVQNTLHLIFLLVVLTIVITVLSDKNYREIAINAYKSFSRFITRLWAKIDPIGNMKNYIGSLKQNQVKIIEYINKLRGVIKGLAQEMAENERDKEQKLQESSFARKDSNLKTAALRARQAKMLNDANISLHELMVKLELLLRVCLKMKDTAAFFIEDLEFKVKMAEKQRKAIHAGYSAMKKIVKAIMGDKEKELFDMSLEEAANDYASKIGEMEGFIDMTKDLITAVDLKKGVALEQGLALLDEWERKNTSSILGEEDKKQIIQASKDNSNILNLDDISLDFPVKEKTGKGYSNLLDD